MNYSAITQLKSFEFAIFGTRKQSHAKKNPDFHTFIIHEFDQSRCIWAGANW